MARSRAAAAGMESLDELARKAEILERELAAQRQAITRLKEMGTPSKDVSHESGLPARHGY